MKTIGKSPCVQSISLPQYRFGGEGWRVGLLVGPHAFLAVFVSNIALLLLGAIRIGGIVDGIGTLVQGQSAYISMMSSLQHIFINIAWLANLPQVLLSLFYFCFISKHASGGLLRMRLNISLVTAHLQATMWRQLKGTFCTPERIPHQPDIGEKNSSISQILFRMA